MNYDSATLRWAGVGPYYAMFPLSFVDHVIETYTRPGQYVLDPFAGRASSIFSAATLERHAIGIEINPVGWIYGKTKLSVATKQDVVKRLGEIDEIGKDLNRDAGCDLPAFFHYCFARKSLHFLLAARNDLDWRHSKIDRTLMALILIDLHGGKERSFSNQMRQSRAMHPDYSIRWWRAHQSKPPQIDPLEFIKRKIEWRYAKGTPCVNGGEIYLGDSSQVLNRLIKKLNAGELQRFDLLFTSPPYIGISDYHRDQWLRLWMLGGESSATRDAHRYRHDFSSAEIYKEMLRKIFTKSAELMRPSGVVYVRTDARTNTFEITREILKECFPDWRMRVAEQPYKRQTQTALYGDKSKKPGEKDIVLYGPKR